MSSELSGLEKLSIFWDESAIYLLVYAVYALLVCAVICLLETRRARQAGTALSRLWLYNTLLASIATALFTLSLLVSGWYAHWLGGDIAAFAVCFALSLLALYFFKAHSIERLALGYRSALLPGLVAAGVLALPYTLGTLFMFLLAWDMQN